MASLLSGLLDGTKDILDGTEDILQIGRKGFKHARNEVIGILYPASLTHDNIFYLAGRLNPNREH